MGIFQKIKKLFYPKPKTQDTSLQEEINIKKKRKVTKKFDGLCNLCKKEIKNQLVNSFYCKYCNEWYCQKHRIPEQHNCIGNPENPHEQDTSESLGYNKT